MAEKTLWVLGMPLNDGGRLPEQTKNTLQQSDLLIGENRKTTFRILADAKVDKDKPLFLLDESCRPEEKAWRPAVVELARKGGQVALFSDTGMPILFDTGREVLEECTRLGFSVRCVSGPTSWGTACALSGWDPPFWLVGFPPRETGERLIGLSQLRQAPGHCVLMERPYRFLPLLRECGEVFGKGTLSFLAWELDSPAQKLLWGTLGELETRASRFEKTKGEFVLLIQRP